MLEINPLNADELRKELLEKIRESETRIDPIDFLDVASLFYFSKIPALLLE